MGFQQINTINGKKKSHLPPTYTGEGLYDFHGTRYFLLVVK